MAESAFDPENFNLVVLIQLTRIYDLLWNLLNEVNPETAARIVAVHDAGGHLEPNPKWRVEDDEEL